MNNSPQSADPTRRPADPPALTFKARGNIKVVVPAGLAHLSTYVLAEQEDWFEKEIEFVRRLLRPGMRVIDIGANYGLYTLTAARAVGPTGAVWAYEPARATTRFLRKSIALNRFANIHLVEAALSSDVGSGRLSIEQNAELNRLGIGQDHAFEVVRVTTLDAEARSRGWGAIDFIKMDAEGEEVNILLGGSSFLAERSPLIMFEFKHGPLVNRDLVAAFVRDGWALYRLLCPHGFLVPYDPEGPVELNLFACKPDYAADLAHEGLLVSSGQLASNPPDGIGLKLLRRQTFAPRLGPILASSAPPLDPAYARSLDAYCVWRDATRPPAERYPALLLALRELEALRARAATFARLSTYARIAWEAGLQSAAVEVLATLINRAAGEQIFLAEPFWPAGPRFDGIDPGRDVVEWFTAAAIDQLERLRAHSSYFAGIDTLPLLEWLHTKRFTTPEMERRRALMHCRAGRPQPVPGILSDALPDNLNPNLWREGGAIAAELSNVPRQR